jgi:8-oxo-dGTP pyrophosphatase MutT (NUDIX family)
MPRVPLADQTPEPTTVPGAGAVAASSIPAIATELAPALAAARAERLTGTAAKQALGAIVDGLQVLARKRFRDGGVFVMEELRREHPERQPGELAKLLAQEEKFEREFQRKMRERLLRDLPAILDMEDPREREEALSKLLEREKGYTVAREEAMFMRALGKADMLRLKETSPAGAYWKLSPFVREHTLDCLAMGERFWPWEVLEGFQPPVHHGCACYLLGLDEAVADGHMDADQVPDPGDALRRFRQAMRDVEEMEEALEESVIREHIEARVIEEARNVEPLRWAKGFAHGGEFRPTRGGSPGARLRKLFPHPKPPREMRERGAHRWAWVNGVYTRVPHADHWEKKVAGRTYSSPAGSSAVYKDGKLFDGLGVQSSERRMRAPSAPAPVPEKVAKHGERVRRELRGRAVEAIRGASRARPPVEVGDGPSKLLALRQAGYRLEAASPGTGGVHLTFRDRESADGIEVGFDGQAVSYVGWAPAPAPMPEGHKLSKAPQSWDEHRADAFAWVREIAEEHGVEARMPELSVDAEHLTDHAGSHRHTGETMVGPEVRTDIDRAGQARAADRPLSNDEKRGVWSSYWVTAHEAVGHSVNPIDPFLYVEPHHRNLEEALAEELAHVEAVKRLQDQGQLDVLAWRKANPDAPSVRGVYRAQRAALSRLLDRADITDPFDRRVFLEDLKWRTEPADRFAVLAGALKGHVEGGDLELMTEVEDAMLDRDGDGQALDPMYASPGKEQVGTLGYARFAGADLSRDGKVLTLADGGHRRVEKLPLISDDLKGLTDGTALTAYRRGQKPTPGLENSDGTPKNFRYVDSEERAKLILKAFAGMGSPGTVRDLYEPGDTSAELEAKLAAAGSGWTTIKGVPVKRRFDGSYGIGHAGFDGRHLSGLAGEKAAVATALKRAQSVSKWAAMASPGTDPPDPADKKAMADWAVEQATAWFKKLTHSGKGDLLPGEQELLDKAFAETETPKKQKQKPPDPLVGKTVGGDPSAPAPKGDMPAYDQTALKLGNGAGGSNGARWAFDENGRRWLIKQYRGNRDRVATELLSNALYRKLGAKAAVAGTLSMPPGKPDFRQVSDADIGEPPLPKKEKGKRLSMGVVVVEPDGRVWVVEPKGHFGGYEHTFPKGGIEHGLTGQQTALKELWEETGLHAEITGHLDDYEGDTGTTRMYVAVRTGGEPLPDDPTPHVKGSGAEMAAVKLVTPAQAGEMLNRDRDKAILKDALAAGLPKGQTFPDRFPEPKGTVALTYPTLDGEVRNGFKPSEKLGEHYMADALLGNWDFVGMTGDNVLWDENGDPIRIDQGGTLEFRAQGNVKPFGPVPTEVWTMLAKGQGKRGVVISEEQMKAQAADIQKMLTAGKIDRLVDKAPFADEEMRERVRENLKARVAWMGAFARGEVDLPRPLEGDAAHDSLFEKQKDLKLYPEQEEALFAFAAPETAVAVNAAIKGKGEKTERTRRVRDELDSLLRHAETSEDVIGYVPLNLPEGDVGKGMEGKTFEERGFMGLSLTQPDTPAVLRVTLPEGSAAVYSAMFEDIDEGRPDVIVARDTKVRVTGRRHLEGGRVVIDAVLSTRRPYKPWTPLNPKAGPPKYPKAGEGKPHPKWWDKDPNLSRGDDDA